MKVDIGLAHHLEKVKDSVEAAEAAYNDPRYQAAVVLAKAASERELMVIEASD